MASISYLLRRGATYYARLRVPLDLVAIIGKRELVKSLGTKDPSEAKRLMWPVIQDWNRQLDDIRSRRSLTPDDKAHATWQHYEASLERDEAKRQAAPSIADIQAATEVLNNRIAAGEITSTDPLTILDASLDVRVLQSATALDVAHRTAKLNDLRKHLASGETALVAHEVDAYADENKLLIDEQDPDRKDLARRLIRAEIEALERTLERDRGDYSGIPKDPIVKPATGTSRETAAPGQSIMELFAVYQRENPKRITADTLKQARRDIGLFVETVGATCPIHRIDKKAVREWKALLMRYPVKASETKAFAGMTMAQIIKANETEPHRVCRRLQLLRKWSYHEQNNKQVFT